MNGSVEFRDPEDLEPEIQEKFMALQQEAKDLAKQDMIDSSLKKLEKAFKICPTLKLKNRIQKIMEYLEEEAQGAQEYEDMSLVGEGLYMYRPLKEKLLPHQVEGVAWMWGLHRRKKGGILGDDMGLGKTVQIISFLSALFDGNHISNALLIMPVSLLPNWEKEFEKWAPGISYHLFHGPCKRTRERGLLKIQKRGGVVLTSYTLASNSWEILGSLSGANFVWDYVILDEGHKIKNPTKTTKAVNAIPAQHRLLLTGTPIQNNLKELWSLFDFCHQGELLGTRKTFATNYENPIQRCREKCATPQERQLGAAMAESLRKIIDPYFLRRTKAEVMESDGCKDHHLFNRKIPKNDLIIWVYMSPVQEKFYKDFLEHDRVKQVLMASRSPLVELTILKKICDHPRLLSARAFGELSENAPDLENQVETFAPSLDHVSNQVLLQESGKMLFAMRLITNLLSEGHRTLIFSLSRRILDILERLLSERDITYIRVDGSINKLSERERRIELFQKNDKYKVFLLTTQVGGVGLTLTGADRVIIYDPSWNPATDAQAVDRVYRIGQQKPVVVYRLIMCGTVEEKIYRRQIFKDSVTQMATGENKDPHRYFTKQELRDLFTLDDPRFSATQSQLEEIHGGKRNSYPDLDRHLEFMETHMRDFIFGFSDHDLMFPHNPGSKNASTPKSEVVQQMVSKAQELMKLESIARNPQDTAQQMLSVPKKAKEQNEEDDLTRALKDLALKAIEVPASPVSDPQPSIEVPESPVSKYQQQDTSPVILSDNSLLVPESPNATEKSPETAATAPGLEVQSSIVEGLSFLDSQNAPEICWRQSRVPTQDFNPDLSPVARKSNRRKSVAAPCLKSSNIMEDSEDEDKENKSQLLQNPSPPPNIQADFNLQFSFPKSDHKSSHSADSVMIIGDSPVAASCRRSKSLDVNKNPKRKHSGTPIKYSTNPTWDITPLHTSTPILGNLTNSRQADSIEDRCKPTCSTPILSRQQLSLRKQTSGIPDYTPIPGIHPDAKRILEKLSQIRSPSSGRLESIASLQQSSDQSSYIVHRKKKILCLAVSDESD